MKKKGTVSAAAFLLSVMMTLIFSVSSSASTTAKSQAIGFAARGKERSWSDLSKPFWDSISASEEREVPLGYEVPLEKLLELKSQAFQTPLSGKLSPTAETDKSVSSSLPQPLAPTLFSSFDAIDNSNQPGGQSRPPDPTMAVGENHVGVVVNSSMLFYTKTGTLVTQTDLQQWFANVYSKGKFPFDPKIVYDHHEGHWIMMALIQDSSSKQSFYLLSVSQTSDPIGKWWNWRLNAKLSFQFQSTWADYPDLGFDGIANDGAIYITSNQFTFAGSIFKTSVLNILPKAKLYRGAGFLYWKAFNRKNEDGSQAFTLRVTQTMNHGESAYLINTKSFGWDKVTLWKVAPTFPPNTVSWTRQATITIGAYSAPPEAEQLGCGDTLDTIDNRIYNAVHQDGFLYAAFTEAYNWGSKDVAAIRYLKIDTTTNGVSLNITYGADGFSYWLPAIHTDSSSNIVLVFARSSSTEYANLRYTGRLTTDTDTQASALLTAGEICITGNRWGDYFGIGRDPSNGARVWVYGEYAKDTSLTSDWDWGTWVGEVGF